MRCLRKAKVEGREGRMIFKALSKRLIPREKGMKLAVMLLAVLCPWTFAEDAPVVETILAYQRNSGGWPKNYDRKRILPAREHQQLQEQRSQGDTTIDNGATYTEIRLLAAALKVSAEPKLKLAALRGIDYLLEGQLDNGGWPQKFPGGQGYTLEVTFNDNAMIGVMNLLKDIADEAPAFRFVPPSVRGRSAKAVARGIACILRCQVMADGVPTSWCAQHDRRTLAPCRGRSYELPSLSGMESVGIVRFLMRIENPDKNVRRAIEGAVAWFKRAKLTGIRVERKTDGSKAGGIDVVMVKDPQALPLWARFYDLQSNKPIFSSRDGVPRASLAEISHERRTGYSWVGPYARALLDEALPRWRVQNRAESHQPDQ